MNECRKNEFCSKLPHKLCERLCKHCIKTTYAKNSALHIDPNHPWLLLEGIVNVTIHNRPSTVIVPGDIILTPRFRPETPNTLALSDNEMESYYANVRYECLTPVLAATYSVKIIYELLADQHFAKAVIDSLLNEQMQISSHQLFLYHGSAYDAVRYILKLARGYHFEDLTHAQIAYLSGRNRTTVTKALHEIALAEPDLLAY